MGYLIQETHGDEIVISSSSGITQEIEVGRSHDWCACSRRGGSAGSDADSVLVDLGWYRCYVRERRGQWAEKGRKTYPDPECSSRMCVVLRSS